jgi:hypothetical protein
MSESQNQFKGIRRFLWLAVGFALMAAALGSAIYIAAHLIKCLCPALFGLGFAHLTGICESYADVRAYLILEGRLC